MVVGYQLVLLPRCPISLAVDGGFLITEMTAIDLGSRMQ